jgi:hypothetical protein
MDGNCRVPDGTNARNVKTRVNAVKPDAIYLTVKDGERTINAGVDILREDGRVAIPEPPRLDGNGSAPCIPAMSPSDPQKSGKDRETPAKTRGC